MVESPEKIWATFEPHESGKGHPHTYATAARTKGQEYIRADLATLSDAVAEREAEPVAKAVELSGNTGELIEKMAEAIRGDTTSDDTPWATLSEDRKIGWRGDAERALAVVKKYLTARRPTEHAVTDEMVEAVHRIRKTAMRQSVVARIEALEAENARLREALEPFAGIADLVDSDTEGMSDADELELHFHDYLMASWSVSMFRAARRALSASEQKEDGR